MLLYSKTQGRAQFFNELEGNNIEMIISLTAMDEIKMKSLEFYKLLEEEEGFRLTRHIIVPLLDFSIPKTEKTEAAYRDAVMEACKTLESKNVLIHCGAGGRFTSL